MWSKEVGAEEVELSSCERRRRIGSVSNGEKQYRYV